MGDQADYKRKLIHHFMFPSILYKYLFSHAIKDKQFFFFFCFILASINSQAWFLKYIFQLLIFSHYWWICLLFDNAERSVPHFMSNRTISKPVYLCGKKKKKMSSYFVTTLILEFQMWVFNYAFLELFSLYSALSWNRSYDLQAS